MQPCPAGVKKIESQPVSSLERADVGKRLAEGQRDLYTFPQVLVP